MLPSDLHSFSPRGFIEANYLALVAIFLFLLPLLGPFPMSDELGFPGVYPWLSCRPTIDVISLVMRAGPILSEAFRLADSRIISKTTTSVRLFFKQLRLQPVYVRVECEGKRKEVDVVSLRLVDLEFYFDGKWYPAR